MAFGAFVTTGLKLIPAVGDPISVNSGDHLDKVTEYYQIAVENLPPSFFDYMLEIKLIGGQVKLSSQQDGSSYYTIAIENSFHEIPLSIDVISYILIDATTILEYRILSVV